MINPFTAQTKIGQIQQEVLGPLYTMHQGQETMDHAWLLVETGRAIAKHQNFIEDVCCSRLVALVFKVVKLLGGADQLTEEDFDRFTSYVNDGGIKAMIKMLLSSNKEKTFVDELKRLPAHVRDNAAEMLAKSNSLHTDFINGFFKETYGAVGNCPQKLQENFSKSTEFIKKLTLLAGESAQKIS